jgi:hypothetical protein
MEKIKHYRDLIVYQRAFSAAMEIFEVAKDFPSEERYSMIDQIRRSSRSVCSNLAEAWRTQDSCVYFCFFIIDPATFILSLYFLEIASSLRSSRWA